MAPVVLYGSSFQPPVPEELAAFKEWLAGVARSRGLRRLVVLHQVHGTTGVEVAPLVQGDALVAYREQEGDFLMTDQCGIGLGILTADCVPVILQVPETRIVAAVHAGWRGACAGIVPKALEAVCSRYGVQSSQLVAYLGASARACCYRVGQDVVAAVDDLKPVVRHGCVRSDQHGGAYLDTPTLVYNQLLDAGVPVTHIDQSANLCTMHNHEFYSFRRDKTAYRQMTLAWSCLGITGAVRTDWP